MKILHLIPDLEYSGASRQLTLLCQGQARVGDTVQVVALGREGPLAAPLRGSGTTVAALGWRRPFDLGWLPRLRCLVRAFGPEVVHAWRLSALRALALVFARFPWPVLISSALPAGKRMPAWNVLDRWLMRRVCLAVAGQAVEGQRLIQAGLPRDRIAVVPLAVPRWTGAVVADTSLPARPGVVCAGPLLLHKGYGDAVWAMDILHFVNPGLRLFVVGEGPDRPLLQHFAQLAKSKPFIHFLGARADLPALLAGAAVVWVPSLAPAGEGVALEAMALGRPVVASALPDLAAIVEHDRTGLLYPPGDKVALARCTLRLLQDPALARRLGEAGRQRALAQFTPETMVREMLGLYANLAA